MEEKSISMKIKMIADPSESEYTQFSSPKVFEGDQIHSHVIFNLIGRVYSEENLELLTAPTRHCQWPSMVEILDQSEMFFKLSIFYLEVSKEKDIRNSSSP